MGQTHHPPVMLDRAVKCGELTPNIALIRQYLRTICADGQARRAAAVHWKSLPAPPIRERNGGKWLRSRSTAPGRRRASNRGQGTRGRFESGEGGSGCCSL